VISGAGSLTKSGLGTIILSGANAYSGATVVDGGTLQIAGATAATQTGAYTVNSGGTLLIGNGSNAGALTNNNNITANAGGTVAFSRNDAFTYSGIIPGRERRESDRWQYGDLVRGEHLFRHDDR
jgi:autotransporter-associated beta strand protein